MLGSVLLNPLTIEGIVERIHDAEPDVRKAVYQRLMSVDIKHLKIKYRIELISVGLKDRDAAVKEQCKEMCKKWLSDHQDVIKVRKVIFQLLTASYWNFLMWRPICPLWSSS